MIEINEEEEQLVFSAFPRQDEFLMYAFDESVDFVLYGGSIRAGKTFALISAFLTFCIMYPRSRWFIVRKDLPTLKRTTIPTFWKLCPRNSFLVDYNQGDQIVTFRNQSQIIFFPENYAQDKTLDRFHGLEANGFGVEELHELQESTFVKMQERSGSNVIIGGKQPRSKILATCNPTRGWVKEKVYNPFKEGTLRNNWKYVQAHITDNAKNLPQAYLNSLKDLPHYEYQVYVEGQWDIQLKTGGEFFHAFELDRHVAPVNYIEGSQIHISVDNNLHPYISITIWQFTENRVKNRNNEDTTEYNVYQIHEICAADPHNSATGSAQLLVDWLKDIGYMGVVYVYGDATTKMGSTIDDNKMSFLEKFMSVLERNFVISNRVGESNPPVAISGEFINAIYEKEFGNISIKIGENNKNSINDYILAKKNKDGGIVKKSIKDPKTGATYEPVGHLSDTKRYFLCFVFSELFHIFRSRLTPEVSITYSNSIKKRSF